MYYAGFGILYIVQKNPTNFYLKLNLFHHKIRCPQFLQGLYSSLAVILTFK